MRVGQNPAKFVNEVAQPADITVAVVNFIPFLGGYYEHSLDVLKACIHSIHENTDQPFDLMVFDNHSCREVRDFLISAQQQGVIQYLVLSEKNIGKIGAWNYMFGAAQGQFIAFSDSDIYFRPGWLSASLEIFDAFPQVGMVTGRPLRTPMQFSDATLHWAKQQEKVEVQEGGVLDWETYWEHAQSLGYTDAKARQEFPEGKDYLLTYQGKQAYIGAAHFQFVARNEILRRIIPLPSDKPMRGERALDIAVNEMGLLRLAPTKPYVTHMGNRLPSDKETTVTTHTKKTVLNRILWMPGIRHLLLWLQNQIFRLYFYNVD